MKNTIEEDDIEYAIAVTAPESSYWAELHSRGGDLRELLRRIAKKADKRLRAAIKKPGSKEPKS